MENKRSKWERWSKSSLNEIGALILEIDPETRKEQYKVSEKTKKILRRRIEETTLDTHGESPEELLFRIESDTVKEIARKIFTEEELSYLVESIDSAISEGGLKKELLSRIGEVVGKREIGEPTQSERAREAFFILHGFETSVRLFILDSLRGNFKEKHFEKELEKRSEKDRTKLLQERERLKIELEEGDKLLCERYISPRCRDDWSKRKMEDIEKERIPQRRLIDYALLPDYKEIILSKHNWENIFKDFFRDREKTRVYLDDVNDFRNAVDHAKYFSDDEFGHAKRCIEWIEEKIGQSGRARRLEEEEEKAKWYNFGRRFARESLKQLREPEIEKFREVILRFGIYPDGGTVAEELSESGAQVVANPKKMFTESDPDGLGWTEEEYRKEVSKFEKNAEERGSLAWFMKRISQQEIFNSYRRQPDYGNLGFYDLTLCPMLKGIHEIIRKFDTNIGEGQNT